MTYAQLTLPRGKGYSPMIKQTQPGHSGTFYAKIDHSRSIFNGLLSPGSGSSSTNSSGAARANACFAGPMMEEVEDISSATPLVGSSGAHVKSKAHYVIYSPEGQGSDTVLTSRNEHRVNFKG